MVTGSSRNAKSENRLSHQVERSLSMVGKMVGSPSRDGTKIRFSLEQEYRQERQQKVKLRPWPNRSPLKPAATSFLQLDRTVKETIIGTLVMKCSYRDARMFRSKPITAASLSRKLMVE